MFYNEEIISKLLKCLSCNQRINIPKLLSCGETICEICLNKLLNVEAAIIKCLFCEQMHEVPKEGTFPTQNLVVELLKLKPKKVYRGRLYKSVEDLIEENASLIEAFLSDCGDYELKIKSHFSLLSSQIENDERNSSRDRLLREVSSFEKMCLNSLKVKSIQKDQVLSLKHDYRRKLLKWSKELMKGEFDNDDYLQFIYESALVMKSVIENSVQFYVSLHFLGKQIEYVKSVDDENKYELVSKEYSYNDIINIDRLQRLDNNTSAIDYTPLCSNCINQTIRGLWLSLFTNECLAVCFDVFDMYSKKYQIIMKLMDNNGKLLKENNENVNCDLITMTTCIKFLIVAIKNILTNEYQLKIYDLLLNNVTTVTLEYEPLLIHHTTNYFYVLSSKAPFIHVYNFDLERRKSFGQDTDEYASYYMPNVIQVYVRNEMLYVRDNENANIRVLDLHTGSLIKVININLLDCFLHIDLLGRIIVVNKDSKILYLFNEDEEILFEYDLTFIDAISSFCITKNGQLLLNDVKNKLLHIR